MNISEAFKCHNILGIYGKREKRNNCFFFLKKTEVMNEIKTK